MQAAKPALTLPAQPCNFGPSASTKPVQYSGRYWRITNPNTAIRLCPNHVDSLATRARCILIDHSVCKTCAEVHSTQNCQTCRREVPVEAALEVAQANLDLELNNHTFSCIECDWSGDISGLAGHILACGQQNHPCTNLQWGCTFTDTYENVTDHEIMCQFAPVGCDYCTELRPRKLLDQHKGECRKWPVTEGGLTTTARISSR